MFHIEKIESKAPRIPRAEDVDRADLMLGVVLLALTMAFVVGLAVWAVMR